jgi:y4mF family transcriptional regulator
VVNGIDIPEREHIRPKCLYLAIYSRSVIQRLQIAVFTYNVPLGNMDSIALGLIVRRERKAQKLKQAELAAVSGVGIRFIVDLEAGKPTLQLEKVLHVVRTLGCTIAITPPAVGA